MTDFERRILSEAYEHHLGQIKRARCYVDTREPRSMTAAAVKNRPQNVDPIFPTRMARADDYDSAVRFKDTVDRLKKSVRNAKPVVETYVNYEHVATINAKRRHPVRVYFYDDYERYLNPEYRDLKYDEALGLRLYQRPKTSQEKLLDAINVRKPAPVPPYDHYVAANKIADQVLFQQRRRDFYAAVAREFQATQPNTADVHRQFFADVFFRHIETTDIMVILTTVIELAQRHGVSDPTQIIEERLETAGYDIMCQPLRARAAPDAGM